MIVNCNGAYYSASVKTEKDKSTHKSDGVKTEFSILEGGKVVGKAWITEITKSSTPDVNYDWVSVVQGLINKHGKGKVRDIKSGLSAEFKRTGTREKSG